MNIDRMEFLAWMERLMERLDMLGDNIDSLQKKRNSIDGEELLDNQDLDNLFLVVGVGHLVGSRSIQSELLKQGAHIKNCWQQDCLSD